MTVEFNSLAGLGIGGVPDFTPILNKINEKELERLKPTEQIVEKQKIRFNSWQEAKELLDNIKIAADVFTDRTRFGNKTAISSDPEIATATADITAVPGVYPIVVDKIALYHQVGSQRYATGDDIIGQGDFFIGLKDERPLRIKIDSTNNTVNGLIDLINNTNIDVTASLAKLDSSETPYQIILSSKQSGSEGAIEVSHQLQGGNPPLFSNRYNQPTRWYYAPGSDDLYDQDTEPKGASSAVPIFSGEYTGNSDLTINFRALNSGNVGVSENLTLGWKDSKDRSGIIKLGRYDYSSGTEIDLVDGIKISFQGGSMVINDTFSVAANDENFNLFSANDPPTIQSPTAWQQQLTKAGSPMVDGTYKGNKDDRYTLSVKKSGVIGVTEDLIVEYSSKRGEKGVLNFGLGYKPSTPLSLGDSGLTIRMESGALQAGYESSFDVTPSLDSDYWWLFNYGEGDRPALYTLPLNWEGDPLSNIKEGDLYDPKSKKSNASKEISGEYTLTEDKRYKFTARGDGRVGVSDRIYLEWSDDKGGSGTLAVGTEYRPGETLKFDGGLSVALGEGYIFDGDHFYVDAFSTTIQPPQDAEVRVGVTETGQGGSKVTSSTNDVEGAIDGVTLHLHSASEKVVKITIGEDKEDVKEAIKAFVEAYNRALVFMKEALKYDTKTKVAGPLQADNTLAIIQDRLREILVDAIPGLPKDANTLPYAGININEDALIEFDEKKLDENLGANYEKVANLFRNYANSTNNRIFYLNSSDKTTPSGEDGYNVNITKAASQAYFRSNSIDGPINIIKGLDKYVVEIDGRKSEPIEIADGIWTLKQIAKEIKKQVKNDQNLQNINFSIDIENKQLILKSDTYGSRSSAAITNFQNSNLPFATGNSIKGENVQGNINNHPAIGSGRILSGLTTQPETGLQLIVALDENQIKPGDEANIVYTKGKGGIVGSYLDVQLKKNTGPVDTTINNFNDRIDSLEDRLTSQRERIGIKNKRLERQFANAQSKISALRAQQSSITQQGL